jgi:hypothetical protein
VFLNAPPGDTPPVLPLSPPHIMPSGSFFVAFCRGDTTLCATQILPFVSVDSDITR